MKQFPLFMYVLTYDGNFYFSEDGGNNWQMTSSFSGPSSHYFYGSSILPSYTELGKVVIAGSGYSNPGIYVTYNNGESFEPMDDGLPNTLTFTLAGSEDDELIARRGPEFSSISSTATNTLT